MHICSFIINPEIKLRQIINQAKLSNSELGLIKGKSHEIEIQNNDPFFNTQFNIPMYKKEATLSEIQKLQKVRIIEKNNSKFVSAQFPFSKERTKLASD